MKLTSETSVTFADCGGSSFSRRRAVGQAGVAAAEDHDVVGHGASTLPEQERGPPVAVAAARAPARPNAATTSSASSSSRPETIRCSAGARSARRPRAAAARAGWRTPSARHGPGASRRLTWADRRASTPLTARVLARRLDRQRVVVDGGDRVEAELRRGDRQHAGAAAPVGEGARRARASSSSSRHSRVVACAPVPNAWPGSMTSRCVAVAAPTAGGSAARPTSTGRCHCFQRSSQSSAISVARDLDEHVAGRGLERGQRRQLARRAVDHVLDAVGELALLDPGGRQLEQLGEHDAAGRRRARGPRGGSMPTRARRSLPSMRLVGLEGVVGRTSRRAASSSLRCSLVSLRGMATLTTTRRSPCGRGAAAACRRRGSSLISPGWVPAGISSSRSPSSVGTVTVVPSAARGRGHVDDRDEVVAVAQEALVLAHARPGRRGRRPGRRARRRGRGR